MKTAPFAHSVFPWLKANLGTGCLAPLAGNDAAALRAAIQIVDLIGYDSPQPADLVAAFRACVLRMQSHTRHLAFHAIAHVLDWGDRSRIWQAAGFETVPTSVCKHEPRKHAAA